MTAARIPIGIAVVEHQGRVLVGVRGDDGPLAGYAEFPGGKCGPGESPAECAVRECEEETGLRVEIVALLHQSPFDYDHALVDLHFFLCRPADPRQVAERHERFEWTPRELLAKLRFPAANQPVTRRLLNRPEHEPPAVSDGEFVGAATLTAPSPSGEAGNGEESSPADIEQSAADRADVAARRRALAWMPAWFLVSGLIGGYFGEGDLYDEFFQLAAGIAFAVLAYRWCAADARLRRTTLWRYFIPMLVLCPGPLVVVPIYLLKTRGVRGLLSILLAALYVVALIMLEVVVLDVTWEMTNSQ